jgi:hypothetical protein
MAQRTGKRTKKTNGGNIVKKEIRLRKHYSIYE